MSLEHGDWANELKIQYLISIVLTRSAEAFLRGRAWVPQCERLGAEVGAEVGANVGADAGADVGADVGAA